MTPPASAPSIRRDVDGWCVSPDVVAVEENEVEIQGRDPGKSCNLGALLHDL